MARGEEYKSQGGTSCTDTPQQNGVAERKHRHLAEIARSILLSADFPSLVSYREAVYDPLWSTRLKPNLIGPLKGTRLVLLPNDMLGSMLDVKNAFWNGDLNEEVFMTPPPGVSQKPRQVCKLRKALYGLKQAPHDCYKKFATFVTSLGFISSYHDFTLFVKHSSVWHILLSLYVDDMIIIGDACVRIESLKLELAHRFSMKDLGLLCYFLGVEVASLPKGYIFSQSKYIVDLLDRARITNKMVEEIPIDAKAKYTPTDGVPLQDPSLYRTIVGSLIYLTVTHLNISYAVHVVTEYRAMAVTTSEIVWLCWLLAYMGVRISHSTPLHFDNRSAIQIARNSAFDSVGCNAEVLQLS
ncbi:uncharacterized mitochondrial protein-like protein [Tanacetum coccineum]